MPFEDDKYSENETMTADVNWTTYQKVKKEESKKKTPIVDFFIGAIGAVFGIILGTILITVFILPLMCIYAYVLQNLWLWFIVPTFQLPALSFPVCLGIYLIFVLIVQKETSAYTKTKKDIEKDEKENAWGDVAVLYLAPFITLLFGYIIKCYL